MDTTADAAKLHDSADRYAQLLAAARYWRSQRIKGTSTSSWGACQELLAAVAAFDGRCEHPRGDAVFRHDGLGVVQRSCGRCGEALGPATVTDAAPL